MKKEKSIQIVEFENIVQLIQEARNRAFSKVNEELILLYFNVGQVVSAKVAGGIWGEKMIDELVNHIALKLPGVGGFNRRGLYRMKQFYETYANGSDLYKLWINVQSEGVQIPFVSLIATPMKTLKKVDLVMVSPVATQLSDHDNKKDVIVSPVATQLQDTGSQYGTFVSSLMTQISWTNH